MGRDFRYTYHADCLRQAKDRKDYSHHPLFIQCLEVVLDSQAWFLPRYFIPLAGMIFASCMNTGTVAEERFEVERTNALPYAPMRKTALHAALIPVTNSLFAVGLVSLPGMMTGQILSGISPLVAVQYQMVVMCMIFGASGMSATVYLGLENGIR